MMIRFRFRWAGADPVVNMIRERATATPEEITAAVATALAREFGDHPLETVMLARVVSGWA